MFGAVFFSGTVCLDVGDVFFLKFVVHFALAKPTADLDFLLMKDMSQKISQTVLKQTKQESAIKDSALAF